jgi:hypothetical protein
MNEISTEIADFMDKMKLSSGTSKYLSSFANMSV